MAAPVTESATEILVPKTLILPTISDAEYAATDANAGTIFMSGGKIVFSTGTGWETATSA